MLLYQLIGPFQEDCPKKEPHKFIRHILPMKIIELKNISTNLANFENMPTNLFSSVQILPLFQKGIV